MINRRLERVIKKAEREVDIDPKEKHIIKRNIEIEIKYIQQIIKENPEITEEELRIKVISQMFEEQRQFVESAHISGKYYQIEAISKLLKDRTLLKELYNKFKDNEEYMQVEDKYFKAIVYSSNHKKSCEKALEEALRLFWKFKGKYIEVEREFRKENKSNNKKKKTNKISSITRIVNAISMCGDKPTIEAISEILSGMKEISEEETKKNHIDAMEFIGDKLKRYNLLERYKKENDRNLGTYELGEYTYEVSTKKFTKDEIGIEEFFSREFLETLELEELSALSTFWQNRYAKECKYMGEALFAIDTLDLWGKIIQGKKIEINDKQVGLIYSKKKCLEEVSTMLLRSIGQNHKITSQEDKERGYCIATGEKEMESILKQESQNYKRIFDSRLRKIPNDLASDLGLYKSILNYTDNIYYIRNSNLCSMIRNLIDTKKSLNWGIIEDENDTIESDNYILIGIDFEGLNMPIRLHIKRELLKDVLRTYNGETRIPIYEGASDFVKMNEVLPTNILMPLQRRQKQVLNIKNLEINEQSNNRPLVNHLRFLKDSSKYPEHLKIFDFKLKKKVRPPRKYKDLVTGEYFEKTKAGYVHIDNMGEKCDGYGR